MDQQDTAAHTGSRGVPTFAVEIVVALLILAFGMTVLFGSRNLGAGWTSDGPGAGYFPFYIGVILCVASVGILWQTVRKGNDSEDIFADGEQIRRVLTVLVPAGVYVLAIWVIGLYVASAIYIAGFMIILGKFAPWKSVLVALVFSAIFFAMFEVWFKVPLYKGMFDPLAFLGY
jgi:hypothetical protein